MLKHVDRIIQKFDRNVVFFIGDTRFEVRKSRYGDHSSTMSVRATPRGWLQHSVDKQRLARINEEIRAVEKRGKELNAEDQKLQREEEGFQRETMRKLADLKALQRRLELRETIRAKLEAKRDQMKGLLVRRGDHSADKKRLEKKRQTVARDILREPRALTTTVKDILESKVRLDKERVRNRYLSKQLDKLKSDVEDAEEALQEVLKNKEDAQENRREKERYLESALRMARETIDASYLRDTPTQQLRRQFESSGLPSSSDACEMETARLRGEAELLEDVDPATMEEYKELVRSVQDMEDRLEEDDRRIKARKGEIDEIKERWLGRLRELVQGISTRFSHYFEIMGFAGDVELSQGKHEVTTTMLQRPVY